MVGMTNARWLGAWLFLLLLVSCAADTAPREAAAGPGAGAVLPAGLRMTALRAIQEAPGHAFEAREDGALAARIGPPGDEAEVEIAGERIAIAPDDGGLVLRVRTLHVGRQRAARAISPVRSARAEGQ